MARQHFIQSSAATLRDAPNITRAGTVRALNKVVTVPEFTTDVTDWNGASFVVARGLITAESDWSIVQPTTPPNETFVAAIRWTADDEVRRYKLWRGVGEKLSYPVYAGEIIPAGIAVLEIWNVEDELTISLAEEWQIPVATVELPETCDDTQGSTFYAIESMCITLAEPLPTTLDEYLAHCPPTT